MQNKPKKSNTPISLKNTISIILIKMLIFSIKALIYLNITIWLPLIYPILLYYLT